jgi:hypothetical protein
MNWKDVASLRLRNAPKPFKALACGYVLAVSLAYMYAFGNIALVVGLTPKDIAVHYYGAPTKIQEPAVTSGEESLDLDTLDTAPTAPTPGPRPSFKALVGEGHFHLFGMSSFFFGLCLLSLFTGLSEGVKAWLVGGAFLFIALDNVSFMATRFLGPKFALFTALSGGLMGLCFVALWFSIILELFKKKELE